MRHQKDAYNDNHIDIASLSIDAILRTPKYLHAILMAEMFLNGTRYFRDCLLAHLPDPLTWDGRLSRVNAVRHNFLYNLQLERRSSHYTASPALCASLGLKHSADAPCESLPVD